MKCPSCDGRGNFDGIVHINRGDKPHSFERRVTPCDVCGGTGDATDADILRFERGRKHRAERITRGEGLRECARRLHLSLTELSKMEAGRR